MGWQEDVIGLARAVGGDRVRGADEFGTFTLTVPATWWREIVTQLRERAGLTYFDWLSAVDEAGAPGPDPQDPTTAGGFRIVTHLAALSPGVGRTALRHLLVQTWIGRESAEIPSLVGVFAGAGWHERETHEMFGIDFTDGPDPVTLLLPDGFEGHPLRKEFVLASRVVKAWPGAKEPGESDEEAASAEGPGGRRRVRPPGVPDPDQWGPRPPGSPAPDPLAAATSGHGPGGRTARTARPRRNRRLSDPEGGGST